MLMRRLRYWLRSAKRQRALQEEMELHIAEKMVELRDHGFIESEARAEARRRFGSVIRTAENAREIWSVIWLDLLLRDIRYAGRGLRRSPGFAAVVILTLALGLGGNAAIFTVVKSLLLDALPYADADRLVRIYGPDGSLTPLSARMVTDIGFLQRSFERLAAFRSLPTEAMYESHDGLRIAKAASVEVSFFETLGIPAARGRTFRPDEGVDGPVSIEGGLYDPDTARVVVLTHGAWQRLFAGDPGVLGREARINGIPRAVIGVLPHDFIG